MARTHATGRPHRPPATHTHTCCRGINHVWVHVLLWPPFRNVSIEICLVYARNIAHTSYAGFPFRCRTAPRPPSCCSFRLFTICSAVAVRRVPYCSGASIKPHQHTHWLYTDAWQPNKYISNDGWTKNYTQRSSYTRLVPQTNFEMSVSGILRGIVRTVWWGVLGGMWCVR